MVEDQARPTIDELLRQLSKAEKGTLTRFDNTFASAMKGKQLDLWMPLIDVCVVIMHIVNRAAGTDNRQSPHHIKAWKQVTKRRFPVVVELAPSDLKAARWFAEDDGRRVQLTELRRNPKFNIGVRSLATARQHVERALRKVDPLPPEGDDPPQDPPQAQQPTFTTAHELGHYQTMTQPQLVRRVEQLEDRLLKTSLHANPKEDADVVTHLIDALQFGDGDERERYEEELVLNLLSPDQIDAVHSRSQKRPRRRRRNGNGEQQGAK